MEISRRARQAASDQAESWNARIDRAQRGDDRFMVIVAAVLVLGLVLLWVLGYIAPPSEYDAYAVAKLYVHEKAPFGTDFAYDPADDHWRIQEGQDGVTCLFRFTLPGDKTSQVIFVHVARRGRWFHVVP